VLGSIAVQSTKASFFWRNDARIQAMAYASMSSPLMRETAQALEVLSRRHVLAAIAKTMQGVANISGSACRANQPLPEGHVNMYLWLQTAAGRIARPLTAKMAIS